MSGNFDRRDSRRDDRRDNRGYRDPRERSPARGFAGGERRDRRDDRGRFDERAYDDRPRDRRGYEDAQYSRGNGRGGSRGDYHGNGRRGDSDPRGPPPMPASNLPPLPDTVPIPAAGKRLPDTLIKSKATHRPFEVLTNHYAIQSLPTISIHEYDLRFTIPPSSQRDSRSSMTPALIEKTWRAAITAGTFGQFAAFNGTSILWTPDKFGERDGEHATRIQLPGHTDQRPNEVEVTLRHANVLAIRQLVNHFVDSHPQNIESYLNWLNALFRSYPAAQPNWFSRPKGLSFFIRQQGLYMPLQSTGGVLEAIRGLHQGVSTHFNVLSVNVDTSITAFYTPNKPLIELLMAFAGLDPRRAQPTDLLGANLQDLSEKLSGIHFNVTHAGPERQAGKNIKARGLLYQNGRFESAAQCRFSMRDPVTGNATEITVLEYFQSRYQMPIRFPTLPLVNSPSGHFPLEFCVTASGERYKEVLEGQETSDFIKFATVPAFQRSKQIEECVKRLTWHTQSVLPAHGISVSPRMLKVPAVKLRPPPVTYARSTAQIMNGAWNLKGVRFLKPKELQSWGVLYLSSPRGHEFAEPEIENFFGEFHQEMLRYGLQPPPGPPAIVLGHHQADVKSLIKQVARQTSEKFKRPQPGMIFILLHEKMSPNIYKGIKSYCEVEAGIPTQVMLVEKSIKNTRGRQQYMANVSMKVNSKLAGINATVPLPGRFGQGRVMIMGADVMHPSPAQLRQVPAPPSIAALTGTFDRDCVRYTATANAQNTTQESIASGASMPVFRSMVETLVERYEQSNKEKPAVVFYFRDGVGENQVNELLENEVKTIRDLVETWNGKLTVILAQKRHHTRFFPVDPSMTRDKNGNIEPGTVIESGNGSAFVCGHGALQGTVRPSHFRIIGEDDNRLTADEFHALIMHGVHSYSKATRAVHTHAAIYYADKVADRCTARFRTSGDDTYFVDVNERLRHTMWWQ